MFKKVRLSRNTAELITTDAAIMFDDSTCLTDNLSYYLKTFTLMINDTVAIEDLRNEKITAEELLEKALPEKPLLAD